MKCHPKPVKKVEKRGLLPLTKKNKIMEVNGNHHNSFINIFSVQVRKITIIIFGWTIPCDMLYSFWKNKVVFVETDKSIWRCFLSLHLLFKKEPQSWAAGSEELCMWSALCRNIYTSYVLNLSVVLMSLENKWLSILSSMNSVTSNHSFSSTQLWTKDFHLI